MTMAPLVEHDLDDWWKVVDTNLGGTFQLVQAVLPGHAREGAGRIVIIAIEWGVTGWPERHGVRGSKAGLISLTKTLGRELAPEGIIVNAVAPGVIDTPQLEVDARRRRGDPRGDARGSTPSGIPARPDRAPGGDRARRRAPRRPPASSAIVGQVGPGQRRRRRGSRA